MLRKQLKNVTKFHVSRCIPGASIVTCFFCPRFEVWICARSSLFTKKWSNCKINAYLHTPMRTHYHIFVRIIKQRLREWNKTQCSFEMGMAVWNSLSKRLDVPFCSLTPCKWSRNCSTNMSVDGAGSRNGELLYLLQSHRHRHPLNLSWLRVSTSCLDHLVCSFFASPAVPSVTFHERLHPQTSGAVQGDETVKTNVRSWGSVIFINSASCKLSWSPSAAFCPFWLHTLICLNSPELIQPWPPGNWVMHPLPISSTKWLGSCAKSDWYQNGLPLFHFLVRVGGVEPPHFVDTIL